MADVMPALFTAASGRLASAETRSQLEGGFSSPLGKQNSMQQRHGAEQIIRILRETGLHAAPLRDPCKQHDF